MLIAHPDTIVHLELHSKRVPRAHASASPCAAIAGALMRKETSETPYPMVRADMA